MAIKNLADVHEALLNKVMNDRPIFHFRLEAFDKLLDGFHANRVNIISGSPGAGKSTFIGQLADDAASNGAHVFLHSYEIAASCYYSKSLVRASDGKLAVSDLVDETKADLVRSAAAEYSKTAECNITFLDEAETIANLKDCVEKGRRANPDQPIMVVVDYIQIAVPGKLKESTEERLVIRDSLNLLRSIAKYKNVSIFVVSAISRSNYDKAKPSLGALSGAASLEYSADACIHLSTDEEDSNLPARKITLSLIKNRYGQKGEIEYVFDTEHACYIEKR